MTPAAGIAIITLIVLGGAMILEALRAQANERQLRERGAVEPANDVFVFMRVLYPLAFLAMAIEGALGPGARGRWLAAGVLILLLAKALKYWAIAALGPRWAFRVLTMPGEPLVATGPYRLMRHPNYAGVLGELLGMSLVVGAPVGGAAALVIFGLLLARRVAVEEHALDRATAMPAS